MKVEGDAGADGRGSALNFSDRFENVNFTMEYKVFQVADTEDPTICEVYFLLSNYVSTRVYIKSNFCFSVNSIVKLFRISLLAILCRTSTFTAITSILIILVILKWFW